MYLLSVSFSVSDVTPCTLYWNSYNFGSIHSPYKFLIVVIKEASMKPISCKLNFTVSYSKQSKLLNINIHLMCWLFYFLNKTWLILRGQPRDSVNRMLNFFLLYNIFYFFFNDISALWANSSFFSRISVKIFYIPDALTFKSSFMTSSGLNSLVIVIILRIYFAYFFWLYVFKLFITK